MQKLFVLTLIALTLSMLSCGSTELPLTYNSIRGSGTMISVLIDDLEPFHSVKLNTVGDVNLTSTTSDTNTVEVTINHNLLRFITTEVTHGVLLIGLKTPQEVKVSDQDLTVDITMSVLNQLTLGAEGVGDIKIDSASSLFHVSSIGLELAGVGDIELNLIVDSTITSTLTGVGDLTLSGAAHRHELTHEGVGEVHAFGFVTDSCNIVSDSEGDIEVEVRVDLKALINNSGNVYYRGYPAIDTAGGAGPGLLYPANE